MNAKNMIRNPVVAALLGAVSVAAPITALQAIGGDRGGAQDEPATKITAPANGVHLAAATQASPYVRAALPDFSALVKQYGPAVVNIRVKNTVKTSVPREFRRSDPNNPFEEFFRQFPMPQPDEGMPMRGEGSGFIVSSDGVILTNAHVVANAKEVTVKLTDRREFTAKVIGQDQTSDVAVLKIEADKLPAVRLGDPKNVQVGEWVVAIGAPFGFENSVTQGIVSAKGRTLPDGSYVPFLQTDVAINPGNSGGPLFNLNGEVIGMNSQIYSRSGGYQGVAFAIPIDVALNVSKQLRAGGKVSRGKLGVVIQPMDQALARSFGLDQPRGALIASVEKGSAAEKAGIEAGDIITSFNGEAVNDSSELPAQVAAVAPGSSAKVGILRDKKERELSVKLGEMGATQLAANSDTPSAAGKLGLAVRPLTAEEQREAETNGLLVEEATGAAAEAGIRAGDIVLSANGKPVKTVEDLRSLVSKSKDHMALLIQRGDNRLFVPVQIG